MSLQILSDFTGVEAQLIPEIHDDHDFTIQGPVLILGRAVRSLTTSGHRAATNRALTSWLVTLSSRLITGGP